MAARSEKKLSAREIDKALKPGMYGDGGGLYLQVSPSGTKSWLYRYGFKGKTRDMGLGGFPAVSLAVARVARDKHRDVLKIQKLDPIEVRDAVFIEAERELEAQRLADKRRMTFADAVALYKELPNYGKRINKGKVIGPLNAKYLYQIERAMAVASEGFGKTDVLEITKEDVKRILNPVWTKTPETALRMRGTIEAILDIEEIRDQRSGENPASSSALASWMKTHAKPAGGNHAALPWKEMPAFMAELRKCGGMGARALELTILCGSRQGEARGARWSEIDLAEGVWIVPAGRMKARTEHAVPLSSDALKLLRGLPRIPGSDLVFPAPRGGEMSDMTLGKVVKDMQAREVKAGRKGWVDPGQNNSPIVPHGFRSTLTNWAADYAKVEDEIAERSIAHTVGTDVSRRYKRTDMLERRRAFLEMWASFCNGERPADNVVELANRGAA